MQAVQLRWCTPIWRERLASCETHNAALLATVLRSFQSFSAAAQRKLPAASKALTQSEVNDRFFEWQRVRAFQHAVPGLAHSPEFTWLEENIAKAAVQTLRAASAPENVVSAVELGSLGIDAWAAVHAHGADHGAHVHEGVMLSGVYYLQTPADAGVLRLHDPRTECFATSVGATDDDDGGGRDFSAHDVVITPRAGDLVLFPPWLRHSVDPTPGDEERVTLSFNVHGTWEISLDVVGAAVPQAGGRAREEEEDTSCRTI